jgi:hypothetical protein
MLNRYGPWATMIDFGGNPQLSTFWRRRMTMLAPASKTSLVLSRRSLLWLSTAALLLIALPTVHFAAAGEKEASAAKGGDVAAKEHPGKAPSKDGGAKAVENKYYSGTLYVTVHTAESASNILRLPTYVYGFLQFARFREYVKITPAQEKELAAISRAFMKREEELRERAAKQHAFRSPLEDVSNSDAVRKQMEAILTKEQLTAVRSITTGANGLARLMLDRQLRENVGVSGQQRSELERLVRDQQHWQAIDLPKSMEAIDRKMLAVVTPEQWAKLERDVAANRDIVPVQTYPGPELSVWLSPDASNELGLTAEQLAKVRKVFEEAQMRMSREGGVLTMSGAAGHDAKSEEHAAEETGRNKLAEWLKKDHAAVERILDKKQLAALQKLALRYNFRQGLDMTLYAGSCSVAERGGLLRRIEFSAAQWKEICRLYDEKERTMWQSFRAVGEGALKILRPEQQNKFLAEWARVYATPPAESLPTKGGKRDGLTKVGKGFLIVQGIEAEATKRANGPPRILPPNIDAAAAGTEAIKEFDADHDGKISGEELDKCPGLKAAIDQIDRSGKGEITAEKITARIKAWQDSRLGRMSLGCRVLHNGQALAGAEVKFVPEEFLGKILKVATGKTDANGVTMIAAQEAGPPGVAPGFYRIEISKAGEDIPAKYNTETVLGQEVAMDAKGIQEGITLDLKY